MSEDRTYANGAKRLPIVLCLDISPSMRSKNRIEHLNKAVEMFFETLCSHTKVRASAEVAIVTFSSDTYYRDFSYVDTLDFSYIETVDSGGTIMSTAILKSIDLIDEKRTELDMAEAQYYTPVLVIVTDGNPDNNDDKNKLEFAINRVDENIRREPAEDSIFPIIIGVGDEVSTGVLNKLAKSADVEPIFIDSNVVKQELDLFKECFRLISQSIVESINQMEDAKSQKERMKETLRDFNQKVEQGKRNAESIL